MIPTAGRAQLGRTYAVFARGKLGSDLEKPSPRGAETPLTYGLREAEKY